MTDEPTTPGAGPSPSGARVMNEARADEIIAALDTVRQLRRAVAARQQDLRNAADDLQRAELKLLQAKGHLRQLVDAASEDTPPITLPKLDAA